MEESCRAEIERLHAFFVEWFTASTPQDSFEPCHQVLAANMVMIDPSGKLSNHAQLIQGLRSAYGCHKGEQFSIEIRNSQLVLEGHELCIMTYEEWQLLNSVPTSRRSTALFRSREDTPNGVEWVHLHETWMNDEDETNSAATTHQDSAATIPRAPLNRDSSLVSKRRHLSPHLAQYQATVVEREGEVIGIELKGWKITTQQGSIGDDAWFSQATERLQEMAQPPYSGREDSDGTTTESRQICLPEMVFPRAQITIEQGDGLKLKFGAYPALLEWARAHRFIPISSSKQYRGVSVLKSKDAKLWSSKKQPDSSFHYDWTFSTPHACTTTMDVSWKALDQSGMNMTLLKDTADPILLFDEVVLYEDDLHDNGQVTLTCKIRVMPTCAFMLERLWVRVDDVLLRVRDTRVSLEFASSSSSDDNNNTNCSSSFKIVRDCTWRECLWDDLAKHGLPTDVRSWCPETGRVTDAEWQANLQRLPQVALPDDLPAFAVLDEDACM